MLTGQSVTRVMSQINDEEPRETIIIKRCKMLEETNTINISEEELQKIIEDLESASDEDLEYVGDEEMDDTDVSEMSDDEMMSDDIEDEYL
jgi:hypothetical protein